MILILKGDPLYNYYLIPYQISADKDLKEYPVNSANECANQCNSEKDFKCRSFNLCDKIDGQTGYRCLLSNKHNHDKDKNSNLIYNVFCQHYSSNL